MKWSVAAVLAVIVLAGCAGGDADAKRRRWAIERRHMEDTLESLEDRLLVNQARVRFWREMKERHQDVTAVACENQNRHAQEMALFGDRERRRREERGRRVAATYVLGVAPASN